MQDIVPHFGPEPQGEYRDRPSAYALIFNDEKKLLVVKVAGEYHLPGGGIERKEAPEEAVQRETLEEVGALISDLEYIGQADQYFEDIALYKRASFYKARFVRFEDIKASEADHIAEWMTPDEFISGPSGEYQRWAVRKALNY